MRTIPNKMIQKEAMTDIDDQVQDRNARPSSPCVLNCTLDDDKRCLGCRRTLEQISGWALMSVAEQWAVIDELDAPSAAIDATIAAANGD